MSCCDTWGDCRQSDDCPNRTGVVLPHQCAHARRVACIKSTRSGWTAGRADTVPPEAGNVRLPPVDQDDIGPLGHDETMALVWALLWWLVSVVCTVGAVALAVGYGTERWSDALWDFLRSVS